MTELHLWEIDHPYYSAEGNFFSNDYHTEYSSWQGFMQAEGDNDLDMNLLFRWDWKEDDYLDPDGLAARQEYAARFGERDHAWTLWLFWVLQRKGIYRVTSMPVCKGDEPAVREYLATRAAHMRLVWEPLLDEPDASPSPLPGGEESG